MAKGVKDLVAELAGDERLFREFKAASDNDAWVAEHGYEVGPGVTKTLASLTWRELKAIVKARNLMDRNDVENELRLQMV